MPHRDVGLVLDHLEGAPVGSYDGLDRGIVQLEVGGVDGHADGGDLEVVATSTIAATPRTSRRLTHAVIRRPWQRRIVEDLRAEYAHQLLAASR
ncbi:hypothetical protein [Nonomuraea guangzhouensis]|uniref:Uncharacterized protein n=1 Tax=Nonomuraea guangzhouensis TaxID=1291555 RepID=A0ABW4G8L4_9ACTN|nr:hypothetical protein [Nonomuraea guangzhouensis]